jgi:trimeric autotransporter adhesin
MNTGLRQSPSARLSLFLATMMATLLLAPMAAQAQYLNTATGIYALYSDTTGGNNSAFGVDALYSNTTGNFNIALGFAAGESITTGSNNIAIGNVGSSADIGVLRIGTNGQQKTTYIAGISGVTASGGVAVYINANGQLGTLTSSRRFKNDITSMGKVSDQLMNLRPVTFRYNDVAEKGSHVLQYGLIAEEVAKVYPNLVQYDKAGKPFTVYYHLLTPMLLNELQKEHHRSQAQQTELVTQNHKIATQNGKIAALTAMLEKQNADLAALKQALTKLTAVVQTSQREDPHHKMLVAQH